MRDDSNKLATHAGLILRAGAHLVMSGYGRMALLPYVSPSGAWRCEFHVLGYPSRVLFRYSIASRSRFLADHGSQEPMPDVSAEALAQAIISSVLHDVRDQCGGAATPGYKSWLALLDGHISEGRIPLAFHEYSEPDEPWWVKNLNGDGNTLPFAAPPMYVRPEDEPAS